MRTIRLLRAVADPGNRGPQRGQFALQRALRACKPPWLEIGGDLRLGEIPWAWSFEDADVAVQFARWGWPFVIGPNVLFNSAAHPGALSYERRLADAESCVLQFTESDWYAALIREHCHGNQAPVVIWSYPIDPQPDGPLPADYDVLIYHKLGRGLVPLILSVCERRRARTFCYGGYDRAELIDVARRSRCCLYLSADDRGPLALAEIMLAGCPAVGIPRGAPWIVPGVSGELVPDWTGVLVPAIERAMMLDRQAVREWAVERFATARTVETILEALEPIATGVTAGRATSG